MLTITKLSRGAAIVAVLLVVLVLGVQNPKLANAEIGWQRGEAGLGVGIDDADVVIADVSPFDEYPGTATQAIHIKSDYYAGYRLAVAVDDLGMHGDNGYKIPAMVSFSDADIPANHWGYQVSNGDGYDNWRGLGDSKSAELYRDVNSYPSDNDNLSINYGVRAGFDTPPGKYLLNVTYTLSAEKPVATPAVTTFSPHYHDMSSGQSELLHLGGYNLSAIKQVYIDFNDDGKFDMGEECTGLNLANNDLQCHLPATSVGALTERGEGRFAIRFVDDRGGNRPSGQYITYHYQIHLYSVVPSQLFKKERAAMAKSSSSAGINIVLTDDGDVYQWGDIAWRGDNYNFATTKQPRLLDVSDGIGDDNPIIDVQTRRGAVVALSRTGRLYHWGNDNTNHGGWNQVVVDPLMDNSINDHLIAVTLGDDFAVAVGAGGLYSWGYNTHGQLGDNDKGNAKTVPVDISNKMSANNKLKDGAKFIDAAAGRCHVMTLAGNAQVHVWGCRDQLQLWADNGSYTNSDAVRPHDITTNLRQVHDSPIDKIASGDNYNVVLTRDGKVIAWGENNDGQLGNGTTANHMLARESLINLPSKVIDISAGDNRVMALTNDGHIYGWGKGWGPTPKLLAVPGAAVIKRIAAGTLPMASDDNRTYVWQMAGNELSMTATNITSILANPTTVAHVYGANFDKAAFMSNFYVDYNRNHLLNSDELPLDSYVVPDNPGGERYLQIRSNVAAQPGCYDVSMRLRYGSDPLLTNEICIVRRASTAIITDSDLGLRPTSDGYGANRLVDDTASNSPGENNQPSSEKIAVAVDDQYKDHVDVSSVEIQTPSPCSPVVDASEYDQDTAELDSTVKGVNKINGNLNDAQNITDGSNGANIANGKEVARDCADKTANADIQNDQSASTDAAARATSPSTAKRNVSSTLPAPSTSITYPN